MVPIHARFVEKKLQNCVKMFYYLKNEYVGNGMKTIDNSGVQHTV